LIDILLLANRSQKNISNFDNETRHHFLLKLYCPSVTYTERSTCMQYGPATHLRLSVDKPWLFAYVIVARSFGLLFLFALFIELVTRFPRLSELISRTPAG